MKKTMKAVLMAAVLLAPMVLTAVPMAYVEGQQYKPTAERLATSDENKVEVAEMFSYSCPHCFNLEPEVAKWEKTLPENVVFVRVPAIFRDSWLEQARLFYAAEVTGDLATLHPLIFDAIHVDKRALNTEDQILDFVEEQGIDRENFAKAMNSFTVKSKVQKALVMSRTSGITGVPSMIVNGKYVTSAPMAKGNAQMLDVVDFLIQQESN